MQHHFVHAKASVPIVHVGMRISTVNTEVISGYYFQTIYFSLPLTKPRKTNRVL